VAEALYRKWRPQGFDDVVGQDHVSTTLKNQIATDRVGHAYLFVGSRGCGKTTSARILAKAVNIAGLDAADAERIGDAVSEGRALDVIEIDAASHNGVDAMREIIDKVNFHPSELRYKVYIIDEVHMLSTPAFNALLKTLEEPPAHVIFILATTDPQKIPATVLSRCQRFTFKRVPVDKIVGRLRYICEKEGIEADDTALKLIARQATGALRDAISLLDQLSSSNSMRISANDVREALGATDSVTVKALTEGIAARSVSDGFDAIQAAVDQGADARQIARQMVEHLRALVQIKVNRDDKATDAERVELSQQAEQLSVGALSKAIKAFSNAINEMRGTTDAQLPLEMAYLDCVVATDAGGSQVVERVVERIVERPAQTAPQNGAIAGPPKPVEKPQPVELTTTHAPESRGDAVERLQSGWKDFTREINKTNKSAAALLNTCTPQGLVGTVVTLRANNSFAHDKLKAPETSAKIKQALSQWLGMKVDLNIVVANAQLLDPAEDPMVKAAKRLGGQVRGSNSGTRPADGE
jgi:DNA polymerase-3 subunit gamma/tau